PDNEGRCEVDFSSNLNALLRFFLPKIIQLNAQRCTMQGCRYYIRYFLTNAYEPIVSPVNSPHFTILKGGLAYEKMDIKTFFQAQKTGKKFFLFDQAEKLRMENPLWLSVLIPADTNKLTLIATCSLNTGSGYLFTKAFNQDFFKNDLVCIPAGLGPVQHNDPNAGKITAITYELRDGNNQ